jgi:hypothetical protein
MHLLCNISLVICRGFCFQSNKQRQGSLLLLQYTFQQYGSCDESLIIWLERRCLRTRRGGWIPDRQRNDRSGVYILGNLRDKPDSVWNTLFSLICCNHGLVTELRSVRWWSDIKGRYVYYHTLPDITKILYILESSCWCNTVYCCCWWKMLFRRNCLLLSLQCKFKANLTIKVHK